MQRVALIVTNATGPLPSGPTGLFLPELAHPYFALLSAGYQPVLVSPSGGVAANDLRHIDQVLDDPLVARFYRDRELMALLETTAAPEGLDAADFAASVYVGGHGAPFDFRSSDALNRFSERIHAAGGVIAAVCHGVCGLIDLEDAHGQPLVAGRRVTGFSNDEEGALREAMPYLLEDELLAKGAVYSRVQPWRSHVVTDARIVTGQQHRSAEAFSSALLHALGGHTVRAWFNRLPNMSDEDIATFVAEDMVNHPAPPPLRNGLAAFQRVLGYVRRSAAEQAYVVEELVQQDDLVVARVRWQGRFTGEYFGVTGNGRPFDAVQYHTFRLRDGTLVEHWAARDDLSMFRQTGVRPPS